LPKRFTKRQLGCATKSTVEKTSNSTCSALKNARFAIKWALLP
jgi:hypothetical protein